MGRSWKVAPALEGRLAENSGLARVWCLYTSSHSCCICKEREKLGLFIAQGQNECHTDGRLEKASQWRRCIWMDPI